jgi:hypothetical protein
VKKSVIFIIAFILSIVFTFIPSIVRASFSKLLQSSIAAIPFSTLLSILFSLVGLAVFFSLFYYLAKNMKINAVKPTVIAILLGVMLGPAILSLLNILLYPSSYFGIYISMAVGSAVSAIFGFFFPALTALLFVELREKKSNNNPLAVSNL